MKSLITIIVLLSVAFSCTQDVKQHKDLLTLSDELNQCIEKNEESCCPIYNELVFESAIANIELDHTLCPLF